MKNRPRGSRPLSVLLTAIAALAVAGAAAIAVGMGAVYALDRPGDGIPPAGADFTVRQGEPAISVASRLGAADFIRSELLFRVLLKARGLESALKAGAYRIEPGMQGTAIMDMIAEGRQALARLRVPEGASLRGVADLAEQAGIATAAEVMAAALDPALAAELGIPGSTGLEGYLFPDTYLLPREAGAGQLLRLMVKTFRERLAEAVPESAALSADELRDAVILASVVEREYRVADEAPLMASVFRNRVRIGMALQSCATVVYVITERLGKPHPERIFDRDLELQDPYNTYRQRGLPPGPICNPGLVALGASLRPASTKYLYFRLVDEAAGRHYFSETLDEHIGAASLAVKPRSP